MQEQDTWHISWHWWGFLYLLLWAFLEHGLNEITRTWVQTLLDDCMWCQWLLATLRRYFKQTLGVLDLLLFFLSLVPISVFIVDLNMWHVLLTSTDDYELGCTALKHRNNDNDLGKLEKWFGFNKRNLKKDRRKHLFVQTTRLHPCSISGKLLPLLIAGKLLLDTQSRKGEI